MEVATARGRAATAAIVAAGFAIIGYGYQVFVLPRLLGDPGPGVTQTPAPGELALWLQLPTALGLLLFAAVPLAGAALLLSSREKRRLMGVGLVGAFALPAALGVPSQLLFFTFGGGMATVVAQVLFLGYLFAAAAALVFVGVAIVRDRTVGWTDPRRTHQATLRLVLLGAVVLAAVAHLAPPVTSEQGTPPWAGGMFSGGIMPGWILQQFVSLVLPLVGVVAVGLAAAGARPTRVGAAAAAVLAAHEVLGVVGTGLSTVMTEQAWGHEQQLTVWYWTRVAVVLVLVGTVVLLWRHGRHGEAQRGQRGRSGLHAGGALRR